jgi:hypothetical protein
MNQETVVAFLVKLCYFAQPANTTGFAAIPGASQGDCRNTFNQVITQRFPNLFASGCSPEGVSGINVS